MSVRPCLFASDDCNNCFGGYFDHVLENPHLSLPIWSDARPHINRIFSQLHSNMIGRVNQFFDYKCLVNCVSLQRRNNKANIEHEWKSHKATADYFVTVVGEIERRIEKESKYEMRGLEPLIRELPRLRDLLTAIQLIIQWWPTLRSMKDSSSPTLADIHPESLGTTDCISGEISYNETAINSPIPSISSPLSTWKLDIAWMPVAHAPLNRSNVDECADCEKKLAHFEEWTVAVAEWKNLRFDSWSDTVVNPDALLAPIGKSARYC